MFCSNCGKKIDDNIGYCPDCQNITLKMPSPKSHKLLKNLCIVLLIILAIGFLFRTIDRITTRPENNSKTLSEESLTTVTYPDNKTIQPESIIDTTETQTTQKPNVVPSSKPTEDITFDTIKEYNYIILYDFEKEKSVGATEIPDDIIDFKGLYGLHSIIQNNELSYNYYRNTLSANELATIELHRYGEKKPYFSNRINANDIYQIDITNLENGLYYFLLSTTYDKSKSDMKLFIYVNGDDSYLCNRHYGSLDNLKMYRTTWYDTLNKINPNDCLDLSEVTYPTSGAKGHVTHVDKWIEKGNDLAKNIDNIEDMIFAFSHWISRNIAYDNYKANVLNQQRAYYLSTSQYDAYCDDNNFAYYNGVGVCWDYTNILTIMCRSHGIPCTSVENPGHTYNAVYLRGHWIPIDITSFNTKICNGEDTTKLIDKDISSQRLSAAYGIYTHIGDIESIGQQIWTFEHATQ